MAERLWMEILMKSLLRAGALGLLLATAGTSMALAQAEPHAAPTVADSRFQATTLNLSAYGESHIAPDMATISLGVTSTAATAAQAMAANATQMTQVVAALKKAGIAAKDIQTSGLNLNAQYAYEQNQPPKLTGYQASNQVAVIVHDLPRLGAAVDATVNAGANQINGIGFGLQDPTTAENAARQEAVKALQAKADLYAKATGYRVTRLVSLNEGGGYAPPAPMAMTAYKRGVAQAPESPVEAGELKVRIDITGLYEVTR
jgi:hypothetical protein